jgi:hypothetical protein
MRHRLVILSVSMDLVQGLIRLRRYPIPAEIEIKAELTLKFSGRPSKCQSIRAATPPKEPGTRSQELCTLADAVLRRTLTEDRDRQPGWFGPSHC